jgi:hypothetical protein
MTGAEWLGCDDPGRMLEGLRKLRTGDSGEVVRKLSLFALACARRVWHLMNPVWHALTEQSEAGPRPLPASQAG